VIGKPIVEIMGADGFDTILPHIQRVLSGHPVEFEAEVPYRNVGPRFVRVNYTPAREPDGHIGGWVASISDITAHREVEAARRRSDSLKSAILASALDCVISMDQMGNVIEFTPAAEAVFGYSRSEVLGNPMAELIIPPRLREQHR